MTNPVTINLRRRSSVACIKTPRCWLSRQMALLVCLGICVCTMALPAAESAMPKPDKPAREAPAGFDNLSNGFEEQQAFDKDRATFEEVETILPEKAAS